MAEEYWMCRGKHPYENYEHAKRHVVCRKTSRKNGYQKEFGCSQRLVIYRCRYCHHWHLGNVASKS